MDPLTPSLGIFGHHPLQRPSSFVSSSHSGQARTHEGGIDPSIFSTMVGGLSSPSCFTYQFDYSQQPSFPSSCNLTHGNKFESGSSLVPSSAHHIIPYFSPQPSRNYGIEVHNASPFESSVSSVDSDFVSIDDTSN